MFAPAGTPAPILDKVHAEMLRITSEPGVPRRRTSSIARSIRWCRRAREFAKFIADNRAFAARVAKESNIQPQ